MVENAGKQHFLLVPQCFQSFRSHRFYVFWQQIVCTDKFNFQFTHRPFEIDLSSIQNKVK